MPALSLRPKDAHVAVAPQAPGFIGGWGSAYAQAAVERGFQGVVPAGPASPVSPARRTFSLRGPVKPPAPEAVDDDNDLGNLTSRSHRTGGPSTTMAGSAAMGLRKSLRQHSSRGTSSKASTPEPACEDITPRPPSGGKPSRLGSRPTPQAPSPWISQNSQDDSERPSYTSQPQTPNSSRGTGPVAPTGPLVDDDEWRLSNFSFRSSKSNSSRYHRAKSTPSRGRHHRPTNSQNSCTSNGGEEHSPAGVIQAAQQTQAALRGGRIQRLLARQDSGSRNNTEERDSRQSRPTGTFTSRNTSRTGTYNSRCTEESGRGTFNFGDQDMDGEAMLNETMGDY